MTGIVAAWPVGLALLAAGGPPAMGPVRVEGPRGNLSLQLEIGHHLDRGAAWLRERQDRETGAWGKTRKLEMTGLVLTVLMGIREEPGGELDPALSRGYAFLVERLATGVEKAGESASNRDWLRVVPALFFVASRPEIPGWMRAGICQLQDAALPGWEEDFRRREALHAARALGFADGLRFSQPEAGRPAGPGGDLRRCYLEAVIWSWEDRDSADWEGWRAWARAAFAEHLRSTDVRLHEAMAKALLAARVDRVQDGRGREVDWRETLAVRMFDLQRREGSWAGEIPAAAAADETLETTCRALLALQTILKSL